MLKEFSDFNREKFLRMLKWTSATFTIITLIGFSVGLFLGYKLELGLSLVILFSLSIFFPVIFMTLGTFSEFLTYKTSRTTLNKYPFSELLKYGFHETFLNKDSKWNYTQFTFTGEYDNYPMFCKVSNSIVKIVVLVDVAKIKGEHRKKLKVEFGWRIEYYWDGIGLTFDTSKKDKISFGDLMNDIRRLIELLKKESLFPDY